MPVEAIPNAGYHFDQWSDGSTDNPRTELNVTGNLSFTAAFANEAPSIAPVTDRTVLEDSGTSPVTLNVSDLESAASTLVVSAASSNTSVVPHPTVAVGLVDGERVLSFAPVDQQNGGPVSITLTITDPAGGTSQQSFEINVTAVNDAPTLSLGSVTPHAAGTSGVQSVPNFASVDFGPDDEDAVQSVDDYLLEVVSDPAGVVTAIDLANNGTLSYTLSGIGGTAAFNARVHDDGGTANGGVDTSPAQPFTIEVMPRVDLQIARTNHLNAVLAGEDVIYAIVAANAGPDAVSGAIIGNAQRAIEAGTSWMCVQAKSTANCPTPDAGNGDLATIIELGVDQYIRFDVLTSVEGAINQNVGNTTTIVAPAGVTDLHPENNRSADVDPVVPERFFLDDFESDAGSNLTVPGAAAALE